MQVLAGEHRRVSRRVTRRNCESGHTLLEITISMGITALLATGFFQVFGQLSKSIAQEGTVSLYQDRVRVALHYIARDLRLAGANPSANPDLFDGVPADDVAVDIDPDKDGDVSNGILVRADRRGTEDGEADGDISDNIETIMYHYERENARLMRHTWRVEEHECGGETHDHAEHKGEYDASPYMEGICSFKMTYYDRLDKPTTVADEVASVVVDMTTASGPGDCFNAQSFTRFSYAIIRIRNR